MFARSNRGRALKRLTISGLVASSLALGAITSQASAFAEGGQCNPLPSGQGCFSGANFHTFTYVYSNIQGAAITYVCASAQTEAGTLKQTRNGDGSDCAPNAITKIGCFLATPTSKGISQWIGSQGGTRVNNVWADTAGGGMC